MLEPTFGSLEFAHKKRKTRRERFLERIDALVPWAALEARVSITRDCTGGHDEPIVWTRRSRAIERPGRKQIETASPLGPELHGPR